MTATDELRRLLDERGVEWRDDSSIYGTRRTVWTANGVTYVAAEVSGRLKVSGYLTPEQAVEATLGRGTCKDSNRRFNAWMCSECAATMLLMFDDYDEPSYSVDGVADVPRYCPNCGRKVVDA